MELLQWLTGTQTGRTAFTMLVAMIPVVELRGAIPFGVGLGLATWEAFAAGVVGNLIPIPFIIVYIRRIFKWLRERSKGLDSLVNRLEERAHLKGRTFSRYRALGLCLFVAIPLPGTGAWTGALAAAFLDMRLRDAMPSVILGVVLAGFIVTGLTYGFTFLMA